MLLKHPIVLFAIMFLCSCSGQGPERGNAAPAAMSPGDGQATVTAVPMPSSTPPPLAAEPATASPIPTSTILAATRIPPTVTSSPPAATDIPHSVTFAVIGDYGTTGAGTQEVAALVNSWDPDLVLTLGDNNYPDGAAGTISGNITQHYGRYIDEKRFFPTLGNHDMTTDFGRPYLEYFELPGNERTYEFVQGDVHFFALNSDWREVDGIGAGSRQAQWLQERLALSTAPWQVVYFHAPPYVSMKDKEVAAMRWPFAEWGADLVLSGHAHLYERLQIEGITYVVNGLGGGGIYAFDAEPVDGSQFRFNDDYGALLAEGTAGIMRGQFVTRGGLVVDSFELSAASRTP